MREGEAAVPRVRVGVGLRDGSDGGGVDAAAGPLLLAPGEPAGDAEGVAAAATVAAALGLRDAGEEEGDGTGEPGGDVVRAGTCGAVDTLAAAGVALRVATAGV